jgi:hypothetical protein
MSMYPLATYRATGTVASVTFSSINQDFQHLELRIFGRTDKTSTNQSTAKIVANGDTGANYSFHQQYGTNNTAGNNGSNAGTINGFAMQTFTTNLCTANFFGSGIGRLYDYSKSTKNKTWNSFGGSLNNDTNGLVNSTMNSAWFNTAAITSLTITTNDGSNWLAGTQIDLYGIGSSNATGV